MDFLNNTDIVVAIGFAIFLGILVCAGAPGISAVTILQR